MPAAYIPAACTYLTPQAGQFVAQQRPDGVPRVGGTLAMSRALGDHKYK